MDNLTFTNNILLMEGLKVTHQSSYPVFILLLLNLNHPMHFRFCNLPLNDILGNTVIMLRLLQDILMEDSERYMTYVECVVQAYFVHTFATVMTILIGLTVRLSRCSYKTENPFCDNASLFKLSCEDSNIFKLSATQFRVTLTFSLGSVFITYGKISAVCKRSQNKAFKSKAIKTCDTHTAVYIIMFVSCAIVFFFFHRSPQYSENRKLASIMFHLVPPGLNPLVYGIQTKEIRQRALKLCCRNKVSVK
uniref:G-protein coupled receptors family 1 profile domain-containing protein n=1 Tax=Sinocyclocheilus rhinocerous TaxID=307959 RepID=A0A673KRH1_9TELE